MEDKAEQNGESSSDAETFLNCPLNSVTGPTEKDQDPIFLLTLPREI